jgi:hypothetical protein
MATPNDPWTLRGAESVLPPRFQTNFVPDLERENYIWIFSIAGQTEAEGPLEYQVCRKFHVARVAADVDSSIFSAIFVFQLRGKVCCQNSTLISTQRHNGQRLRKDMIST